MSATATHRPSTASKPKPKMGRRPGDPKERRGCHALTYVTESEKILLAKLSTDYPYDGEADVLRRGLALLVTTKHPELAHHLRDDLKAEEGELFALEKSKISTP